MKPYQIGHIALNTVCCAIVALAGCQSENQYDVDLSKSTVLLSVSDAEGNRLEGIRIGVSALVGPKEFFFTDRTSDSEGMICFDNIAPSEYIFYHMSQSLGIYPDTLRMRINANRTYETAFRVSMQPQAPLVGHAVLKIVDGGDEPMKGAEVALYTRSSATGEEMLVASGSTDNLTGTLRFFNLEPGDYRVSAGYGMVNETHTIVAGETETWKMVVDLIPRKFTHDGWSIVPPRPSEQGKWVADNVIDDDPATWWNSSWSEPSGQRPTHPHIINIDMGEQKTFYGFYMVDSGAGWFQNGCKEFEMLVSDDGIAWRSTGTYTQPQPLSAGAECMHPTSAGKVSARYLRFLSISQWSSQPAGVASMTFAELGIFDYQ